MKHFLTLTMAFVMFYSDSFAKCNNLDIHYMNIKLCSDSDSVAINKNAEVIRFDNRLYQMGAQIGTFDKKTALNKGQLATHIQIYDSSGKAVAEAVSSGVNSSFAVQIFSTKEKFSISPTFDREVEEIAQKLRIMGVL